MNSALNTTFDYPVTIYYEDTDASGVVYHANYLKFMERARSEILLQLKFNQDSLLQQGVAFVVADLTIDYLKPAKLSDSLNVSTRVVKVGKASVNFLQKIFRDSVLISQSSVRIACVSASDFSPCKLPVAIREQFSLHKSS